MLMRLLCGCWQRILGCPPKQSGESGQKPPEATANVANEAAVDDLTAIRGIGIVSAKRLVSAGITSCSDLASSKHDDIRKALAGHAQGAKVEDWIRQAQDIIRSQ